MIYTLCSWLLLLLTWSTITVVLPLQLGEPNVCQKTTSYMEDYTTSYSSTIKVKTYTWCFGVPPRCTKYLTRYVTKYKKAKRLKNQDVYDCCHGYELKGDHCAPICEPGCKNGQCIAPSVCDCLAGWRGSGCDSKCPVGTWGQNCVQRCKCQNNARCHVSTGQCSCEPGFHGPICQYRCPEGTFGAHCSQSCKCIQGQANCDPISGRCQCLPGWQGPLCDEQCTGSYGQDCESNCACQNDGHCRAEDGSCICTPGWTGSVCANTCSEGYYGYMCKSTCVCYNGGFCNHVTGKCICNDGFTGSKCQVQCPYGTFGKNCSLPCLCENNARCDPVDGSCVCTNMYMGPHCSYRICQPGWFGKGCKQRCACNVNSSTCDSWTGECYCNEGYVGPMCEKTCDIGWFGMNCSIECSCTGGQVCDFRYGCVAPSINSAIGGGGAYAQPQEALFGLVAGFLLLVLILLSIFVIVYYRRRYKRLKRTTELMVQYRVVATDSQAQGSTAGSGPSLSVEGGATGVTDNPAHRVYSSGKKHMPLDEQEEHGQTVRSPATSSGSGFPDEPPPPYSPTPQNRTRSPPPYSAGLHTATPVHDITDENTNLQDPPITITTYGGLNSHLNARNIRLEEIHNEDNDDD